MRAGVREGRRTRRSLPGNQAVPWIPASACEAASWYRRGRAIGVRPGSASPVLWLAMPKTNGRVAAETMSQPDPASSLRAIEAQQPESAP
jgi:hypothetical protein